MKHLITRRAVITGAAVTTVASLTVVRISAADRPTVHNIDIKRFKFEPSHIQVKVGDTVRWTNKDLAPHTATANEYGWDTEELTKGKTAGIIIAAGMETNYFCAFHPHMKGSFEIL